MPDTDVPAQLSVRREETDRLVVELLGDWRTNRGMPTLEEVTGDIGSNLRRLEFDATRLGPWNSGLLVRVLSLAEICEEKGIEFGVETLPEGIQRLYRLAKAVPEKEGAARSAESHGLLHRLGESVQAGWNGGVEALTFVGESLIALTRMIRGKAKFRWADVGVLMQECGVEALWIVALINFLVGLILAFVGAVQLSQFGAAIYVADLVGIATVREMGCLMTGIIMCGRTGASFAAQLGTMKVNEEIDSFTTFGFSSIEFLVLPRMIALVLMMPILCVFADLVGIAGGFVVGIGMLNLTFTEYFNETVAAISLTNFAIGIVKGSIFGLLVALTGCLRGIQCGNNAAAVGMATTSAVVSGITCIILADAVFAVLCNALGI